ncbi:hypothetical protein PInf_024941 [Phytophthora infestans]|nr:hypothetical protein PInf_024941 [Phytophthora infestans]
MSKTGMGSKAGSTAVTSTSGSGPKTGSAVAPQPGSTSSKSGSSAKAGFAASKSGSASKAGSKASKTGSVAVSKSGSRPKTGSKTSKTGFAVTPKTGCTSKTGSTTAPSSQAVVSAGSAAITPPMTGLDVSTAQTGSCCRVVPTRSGPSGPDEWLASTRFRQTKSDHFRGSAEFGSAELVPNPVPSTKGWTTARERFYRSPSAEAAQLEVLRHPGYPTNRPAEYAGLSFARSETLSYPDRPNLLALPINTLQAMPLEY